MKLVGFNSVPHRSVILTLIVLAVITAVFALPFQLGSTAAPPLNGQTETHEDGLPNYDK